MITLEKSFLQHSDDREVGATASEDSGRAAEKLVGHESTGYQGVGARNGVKQDANRTEQRPIPRSGRSTSEEER